MLRLHVVRCVFLLIITGAVTLAAVTYELLYASDVKISYHSVSTRNVNIGGNSGTHPSTRGRTKTAEVQFSAFNRNFELGLHRASNVVRIPQVVVEDENGRQRVWDRAGEKLWAGEIRGEPQSVVLAHLHDDGRIFASLDHGNTSIRIEPARSVNASEPRQAMAIYKADVRATPLSSDHSWCGVDNHHRHQDPGEAGEEADVSRAGNGSDIYTIGYRSNEDVESSAGQLPSHRTRRSATAAGFGMFADPDRLERMKNRRCPVVLIADYSFYKSMGESSIDYAANYLILLLERINRIFLQTEWRYLPSQPSVTGIGLVLDKIVIHSNYTSVTDGMTHYNARGRLENISSILTLFSLSDNGRNQCLAHLFTGIKFENGTLGYAYVASQASKFGGICSPSVARIWSVREGEDFRSVQNLNVGLSTIRNRRGELMTTVEADLVTAHEMGHSWGSEHDPDTSECIPDEAKGGRFLMHTYSVSGRSMNNFRFSPCSIRNIVPVLHARALNCFRAQEEGQVCGNMVLEYGEECDPGVKVLVNQYQKDTCCTTGCKFTPGSVCSDRNHPCCKNCRIAPNGTLCKAASKADCLEASLCNGDDFTCPVAKPMPDGNPCFNNGTCKSGLCVSFCQANFGLEECLCSSQGEDACKRCCRTNDGACKPVKPTTYYEDGSSCEYGYCSQRTCRRSVWDHVNKQRSSEDRWKAVRQKDLLVFWVVGISAALWIPVSCIISRHDAEQRRKFAEACEKAREMTADPLSPRNRRGSLWATRSAPHSGEFINRPCKGNADNLGGSPQSAAQAGSNIEGAAPNRKQDHEGETPAVGASHRVAAQPRDP